MSNQWNKVILFGDSLTQRGFEASGCWASLLADRLVRVSDVIVRGFSGYNSRWLRMIAPKVFPKDINAEEVSCLTILLGANDSNAVDSPTGQYVPIDEYENNLIAIIDHLESIHIPRDRIVLMSSPNYLSQIHIEFCKQNGRVVPKKDNETVGQYAIACRSAAQRSSVEFFDLFQHFSRQQEVEELFCDGLHFSRKGSQLLFDLIWPSIEKRVKNYKQLRVNSQLIMNFPIYSDIDSECPEKSLLAQN